MYVQMDMCVIALRDKTRGECSCAQGTVPQGLICGPCLQQRGAVWDLPEGCGLGKLPLDFEFRNACLLAQDPLVKAYSLCIRGLDHPATPFKAPEEQADSCSLWEGMGRECLGTYALLRFCMVCLCPADHLKTVPTYLFQTPMNSIQR